MAYKPKPNYPGSEFFIHDIVRVLSSGKSGIITGFDYNSKTPKHIVTFNYSMENEYKKSFSDIELKLLQRDVRILDGLKRYEIMTKEGR